MDNTVRIWDIRPFASGQSRWALGSLGPCASPGTDACASCEVGGEPAEALKRGATHNFEKNLLRVGPFKSLSEAFLGQVRWSEKDALLAAGSACQNVNIWDMKMLQLAYRPEP